VCFVDIWHKVCFSVGVCEFGLYKVILCDGHRVCLWLFV